jgi:hypothetical protein
MRVPSRSALYIWTLKMNIWWCHTWTASLLSPGSYKVFFVCLSGFGAVHWAQGPRMLITCCITELNHQPTVPVFNQTNTTIKSLNHHHPVRIHKSLLGTSHFSISLTWGSPGLLAALHKELKTTWSLKIFFIHRPPSAPVFLSVQWRKPTPPPGPISDHLIIVIYKRENQFPHYHQK